MIHPMTADLDSQFHIPYLCLAVRLSMMISEISILRTRSSRFRGPVFSSDIVLRRLLYVLTLVSLVFERRKSGLIKYPGISITELSVLNYIPPALIHMILDASN